MTPRFLREEAARFRDMASMQEREASRLRLLRMADDYEAKARASDGGAEPVVVAAAEPVEAEAAPVPAEGGKMRLGRRPLKARSEAG